MMQVCPAAGRRHCQQASLDALMSSSQAAPHEYKKQLLEHSQAASSQALPPWTHDDSAKYMPSRPGELAAYLHTATALLQC